MDKDRNAPPLNRLPAVVWILVLPIVAVEVLLWAGAEGLVGGPQAIGWRLEAIRDLAFLPELFDWMAANGRWPLVHVARLVAHPFVHQSFTHMLFVAVFLLALGKAVGEVFAPWAVLAVFFGAAAGGALAYWLLLDAPAPVYGGFPAVYGLLGAFTWLLWLRAGLEGRSRWPAFRLIGVLAAFQILVVVALGGSDLGFVAELAGFGAGFGLSFIVSPGAWPRIVGRVRAR
ncbi:MAG: rhomboid family intramembrane serine protease [Rhodobacteraceae bacterium]|nr:rhomboid family intramembrane serine protease [Paracoccaceae bacterium]